MESTVVVMPLIWLHVAVALTALITGPIAMVSHKGGRSHRRWGKVYFWAMFGIFVSALALLAVRPNVFLLVISILSFYSALSGYRVLFRKRPERGAGPSWLDWLAALVALAAGLGFIGWGLQTLLAGVAGWLVPFAILGMVFGGSLSLQAGTDIRGFMRPPSDRNWWWYYHMNTMLSSYTAAVTAFLVQNVSRYLPAELVWIVWVAPAAVGAVAISYWIRHYRQKFTRPAREGAALGQPELAGD